CNSPRASNGQFCRAANAVGSLPPTCGLRHAIHHVHRQMARAFGQGSSAVRESGSRCLLERRLALRVTQATIIVNEAHLQSVPGAECLDVCLTYEPSRLCRSCLPPSQTCPRGDMLHVDYITGDQPP